MTLAEAISFGLNATDVAGVVALLARCASAARGRTTSIFNCLGVFARNARFGGRQNAVVYRRSGVGSILRNQYRLDLRREIDSPFSTFLSFTLSIGGETIMDRMFNLNGIDLVEPVPTTPSVYITGGSVRAGRQEVWFVGWARCAQVQAHIIQARWAMPLASATGLYRLLGSELARIGRRPMH